MDTEILKGKKVLVVDDEPDVIETLVEALDMCRTESALDFSSARRMLRRNHYDGAVLDIMGVNGYGLLEVAIENKIPAVILTAHALSADNFKKAVRGGAHAYLPKDKMFEIPEYLAELITSGRGRDKKSGRWFTKLSPYYDNNFGSDWKKGDPEFWHDFKDIFKFSREELEDVL
ncbi:MAG: response regulator [Thermodesulfobacteriota bacterium]|nr:response regulator [Thermodesulfobacteriota bacterium]